MENRDYEPSGKSVSFGDVKDSVKSRKWPLMECPNCGMEPDKLSWNEFSSSKLSWAHLAGRAGYYSECPTCDEKVQEIITMMN